MKLKSIHFLILLVAIVTTASCKFYFSESDYLGTYNGDFDSETTIYKTCSGQLVILDAGENLVDMELMTDSNSTFYFSNISVNRGYSLGSESLILEDAGSYGVGASVNRTTHDLYLYYYSGSSYYDYSFRGTRQ